MTYFSREENEPVNSTLPRSGESIREQLVQLAEPSYRQFSASLLPGAQNILGVRLPVLRKLAKKLAREDWKGYLALCGSDCFEEIMLKGFLIGYARTCAGAEYVEILEKTKDFLPMIDNWSVCDSFCATLKLAPEYPERVWEFLQPCFCAEKEFTVRFGVVMLLDYYITESYIDRLFPVFDRITHPGYYVKMAVAWALSMCFVKFPEKTEDYLAECSLDDFTFNKTIQKITESLCVDKETKKRMRSRRRG